MDQNSGSTCFTVSMRRPSTGVVSRHFSTSIEGRERGTRVCRYEVFNPCTEQISYGCLWSVEIGEWVLLVSEPALRLLA